MMIIDVIHCDIIHNMDQELDTIPEDTGDTIILHSTEENG